MNEKEYDALDGVRRSDLWRLNPRNGGTPEKFKWAMEHPEEPTPAMVFGTIVHTLLLEPDRFDGEYAVAPQVDRRTKDGKAIYSEFLESVGDKTVISQEDFETASAMVDVLNKTPFVKELLDNAVHEHLITWVDEMTGEACKIRADSVKWLRDCILITDYKTTTDASPDGFLRKALSLGYDFQAGIYCEGIEMVYQKPTKFVFIAQEKQPPYAVNILEADEAFIQRGRDTFRELIGIYHEAKTTDNWWGYLGKENIIGKLNLPQWAAKSDE